MKKTLFTFLVLLVSLPVFSQNVQVIGDSLFSLTIQERNKNGAVSEIFMSRTLCDAAKMQAELILRTGIPTHSHPSFSSPSERIESFGYRSGSNENITYMWYNGKDNDSTIAKTAINNFMNSRGHRVALLTSFENRKTAYGQCILYDNNRKMIIVVQVFVVCHFESDLLIK